ncbi:MAG: GC-type dockerin domain-anchored protein [Phycisphaerales bacterium]
MNRADHFRCAFRVFQTGAAAAVLIAAAGLSPHVHAQADCVIFDDGVDLPTTGLEAGDAHGSAMAWSGNWLVVGAPRDNSAVGADTGTVRLYENVAGVWTNRGAIVANDAAASDFFGQAVAISGSTLVVGAPGDDNARGVNAGAVYVFTLVGANWTQQAKLIPSNAIPNDVFGSSVALGSLSLIPPVSNLQIFGGSPGADITGAASGSVTVFTRRVEVGGTFYDETRTLLTADGPAGKNLGASMVYQSNRLLVGAPLDDNDRGVDAGAVYEFSYATATNWSETQKLIPSTAGNMANGRFGHALSIHLDLLAVGMPRAENANGDYTGYVETKRLVSGDWIHENTFGSNGIVANPNLFDGLGLGASVAVRNNKIIMGSPTAIRTSDSTAPGMAWFYSNDGEGWTLEAIFTGTLNDVAFGSASALTDDSIVVGANRDSAIASNAGVVRSWGYEVLAAPTITLNPLSQTTCPSGTVVLTAAATPADQINIVWVDATDTNSADWFELTDGPGLGGTYSGTNTETLTIDPVGQSGRKYRFIAWNQCTTLFSTQATVTICIADTDDGSETGTCDGAVTVDDLLYYLVGFQAGSLNADVDDGSSTGTRDDAVTIDDLLYFLVRFAAGC